MQLTDPVAQQYGVERVFNASQNIAGGSAYLKDLMDRFGDLLQDRSAFGDLVRQLRQVRQEIDDLKRDEREIARRVARRSS